MGDFLHKGCCAAIVLPERECLVTPRKQCNGLSLAGLRSWARWAARRPKKSSPEGSLDEPTPGWADTLAGTGCHIGGGAVQTGRQTEN